MPALSGLHLQVVADDADSVRRERPLGRSAEDGARRHIELAAVADAGHGRSLEVALGERAALVGTCVVERVEAAAGVWRP